MAKARDEAWVLVSTGFAGEQVAVDASLGSQSKLRERAVAEVFETRTSSLAEYWKEVAEERGFGRISWWKWRWDCFARTPEEGSQNDLGCVEERLIK